MSKWDFRKTIGANQGLKAIVECHSFVEYRRTLPRGKDRPGEEPAGLHALVVSGSLIVPHLEDVALPTCIMPFRNNVFGSGLKLSQFGSDVSSVYHLFP